MCACMYACVSPTNQCLVKVAACRKICSLHVHYILLSELISGTGASKTVLRDAGAALRAGSMFSSLIINIDIIIMILISVTIIDI